MTDRTKGVYKFKFINNEIKEIDVESFIFCTIPGSVSLKGVDGLFYFWEYVVSVKKE